MKNQAISDISSDKKWFVETIRLTSFFSENNIDSSNWWNEVVGEPPENQNKQLKLNILQEEGSYKNGRLVHTVQPGRTDWIFIPTFDTQTGTPVFEKLPDIQTAIDLFATVKDRWLSVSPPLSRIAFGLILDTPVRTRIEGYEYLANFLKHIQVDPENSTDLLYQINRRRESKILPGLIINRLSKWAVAISQFSQFALSPTQQNVVISGEQRNFARLELDINTAPENKSEIAKSQFTVITNELIELGLELASKGDIP